MQHTILGNQLSQYRNTITPILFNKIIVNISDFDKTIWYIIGTSIMQNLFIYSVSVKWGITDDGLLIGDFIYHSDSYNQPHIKLEEIQIDTQLILKDDKRFLIITKLANEIYKQYSRVIHVTDDGIWLAHDRDFKLQDSIENSIEEKDLSWKFIKQDIILENNMVYDDITYSCIGRRSIHSAK